jgi:hypothetical protein
MVTIYYKLHAIHSCSTIYASLRSTTDTVLLHLFAKMCVCVCVCVCLCVCVCVCVCLCVSVCRLVGLSVYPLSSAQLDPV